MTYKVYTQKEVSSLLKANGYTLVRTGKHDVWSKEGIGRPITMPKCGKPNPMVIRKMIRRYGLVERNI